MITKVFSVYDVKAGFYGQPFFSPNKETALRSFGDACKDEKSMVHKHPSDFVLFEVGEFDDIIGEVSSFKPVNLGSGISFKGVEVHVDYELPSGNSKKVEVA
jgi:hypothetical protein